MCYTSLTLLAALVSFSGSHGTSSERIARQPAIIDTDVGSYVDDSAAIALAARLSTLDVKLVVTCTNDTALRARVVAKMLTYLGRDDIPVGVGVETNNATKTTFYNWSDDFDVSRYRGGVFNDGVAKMAEVIRSSRVPVTIISIGPMTNFPALISRYPDVTAKARIVAMAGSIARGYRNSSGAVAELNVALCPLCTNLTFQQPWNITMAPLDTAGVVRLPVPLLERLFSCLRNASIVVSQMLGYYCVYAPYGLEEKDCFWNKPLGTPALFDPVAVLSTQNDAVSFLKFQTFSLRVTPEGYTVEDEVNGKMVSVALEWVPPNNEGLESFMQSLVSSLCA